MNGCARTQFNMKLIRQGMKELYMYEAGCCTASHHYCGSSRVGGSAAQQRQQLLHRPRLSWARLQAWYGLQLQGTKGGGRQQVGFELARGWLGAACGAMIAAAHSGGTGQRNASG